MMFIVKYENTIDAISPLEAVQKVIEILSNPNEGGGKCFTAMDGNGNKYSVDVDKEDGYQVVNITP